MTRRCTQRQLLLKPSPEVTAVFLYCLAYAASTTGIQLHAAVVLSNHYHLVLTDPRGLLPAFAACLNKLVAKCMNAHYGRWENFWAGGEPTSYVRLLDHEAVLEKTLYTLANPVSSWLVSHGDKWPGIRLGRPGTYRVRRPDIFFRPDGPMPETIELEVTAPPLGDDLSPEAAWKLIESATLAREEALRKEARDKRIRFLGVKAILRQDPFASPQTREPRRTLSPRIASRNKWLRIEALARCAEFVRAYRRALEAWRRGQRDVLFPPGTYGMRAWHGVRCAAEA